MITDAQTSFTGTAGQSPTTGTQVSTNTYDMGVARDIGRGRNIRVFCECTVTFTAGTSLQVNVIGSASSNLGTPTVLYTGAVIAEAALLAGKTLLDVVLPQTTQEYLGLQFVTVGTHTAGTVVGGMNLETDSNTYFPAVTGF